MKQTISIMLCLGLFAALWRVQAQGIKLQNPHRELFRYSTASQYKLVVLEVADTGSSQYFIQVDEMPDVIFKSLYSPTLRHWVSKMPTASTIDYYPTSMGSYIKAQELLDFEAFCKSQGIVFHHYMAE